MILTVLALAMCGVVTAQTKKPVDAIYNSQKDETTYFLSPLVLVKVDIFPTSGVNFKDGVGERPIAGQTIKMVTYTKFTGKSYSTPADEISSEDVVQQQQHVIVRRQPRRARVADAQLRLRRSRT